MNTEKIGKIIRDGSVEALENPKESIAELEKLIAQKDSEIECFRQALVEAEIEIHVATGSALVAKHELRKKHGSESINRETLKDLNDARVKSREDLEKLFILEEWQVQAALTVLVEYQDFFNSLYQDEKLWTSMQRRFLGILKRIMDQDGLILINPVKNVQFNHKRHSTNPVPNNAWRRPDDSEKGLDGTKILACTNFGIKEQDGLHDDIAARVFKRAQVVLQHD